MIKKLGLQLFTVRDCMGSTEAMDNTFSRLVELGYAEAQTAGGETEEMAAIAKKNGLTIIGTHFDYNRTLNDPEGTMALHDALGTKNIGMGGLVHEARDSYDGLMSFIEQYNKAAELYAKHGYTLTYHNHSFEFVKIHENKTTMDLMYENFDKRITFVLDACWVANAGADVCGWLEKLKGRIDILHLKDIKTEYVGTDEYRWTVANRLCEVGKGNIDWDRVLTTAEAVGVKHYTVEQDNHWAEGDPFKSLQISRDFLDKYMVK